MDWSDRAIVIGLRKHGETSVILEAMTENHGRHLGVVRSGRSRSMQPTLQPGNSVNLVWRARLEEHMGVFNVEADRLRAGRLMASSIALQGLHWLAALLRLLPERDPHAGLFAMAEAIADHFDEPALAPELVVRFELAVLAELGFGLDLENCAATGAREDLVFVSPKSGRAVSRSAGAPYADRLLPLPDFIGREAGAGRASADEWEAGFRLAGHFLRRDLFEPRGMTEAMASRDLFAREARRAADK
ncbi:MAG TPA: DNA repair protein RecO [Rhodoblastus sp.]|nr:DNA repair protein RecO [Rhodoblastus sp.]